MIICTCRGIKDDDFKSKKELRNRIMKDDFNCGQCQIKFIIEDEMLEDEIELKKLDQQDILKDGKSLVDDFLELNK
jgi:hypothetical protein